MCAIYDSVTLSFMIIGHTKFSPDWCFGLLKQRLRRCRVDCLDDIVDVVESSAQLVGAQSGETLVPMYNWSQFFEPHFRVLPSIKTYHHFHFNSSSPGTVILKKFSNSNETSYQIRTISSWTPSLDTLPPIIMPPGLAEERQLYLYHKLRHFCREEIRDFIYPPPASLLQQTSEALSQQDPVCVLYVDNVDTIRGPAQRNNNTHNKRTILINNNNTL